MNAPLYTLDILRLAAGLRGPVELERVDGEAELRSPTCGSRIRTAVEIDDEGRVRAMSQQVHACAFGQASAALLEARATGMNLTEGQGSLALLTRWLGHEDERLEGWPELAALAPARNRKARHGAILLPLRTLIAALERAS